MRKLFFLFAITTTVLSCKKNENSAPAAEAVSEFQTIEGEFIYLADAAVLKGDTFIYGVKIDEKMHELANQVAPKKREDFDMVPVVIKGEINPKAEGEEGWDEIVTIKEIIKVLEPTGDGPVKIESTN